MVEKIATRDAFGETLVEMGRTDPRIVVLSGDLEDATRAEFFKKEFPERFFNLGIAEQDMLGTAAGLSLTGLIPFVCSFAVFLTNRGYDLIRISIAYNNRNVKMVGTHAGLTVGEDGATAQCLEDFALMRVLPNIVVLSPADAVEAKKATREMARLTGPVYMRLGRAPFPVFTAASAPFVVGRANTLRAGSDVTLAATGLMVWESLQAAGILAGEGIQARVLNVHTIKPIDREAIVRAARETGALVTAEEHQIHGGLGGAVAEVLALEAPAPLEMVAVRDGFGESGDPEGLLRKYHLKDVDIAAAARRAIRRKKEGRP